MRLIDLGRKPYGEVLELQKRLVEERARGAIEDALILVEHDPVYTIGRASSRDTVGRASGAEAAPSEIKVRGLGAVPVFQVERGGKLTFHGPGQFVGYPILRLPHRDLRRYLRDLERTLIDALRQATGLGVKPCPETLLLEPGQLQTGVWLGDRKLASIGIAVKHWVSYHGFALNLTTDLRCFEAVEPCGFSGSVMTTLERELARAGVAAKRGDAMTVIAVELKEVIVRRFQALSREYASLPMAAASGEAGALKSATVAL